MLEVTIGWPEIKAFIDGGLPFRFVDSNGAYRIYAFDGSSQLVWICVLPLDAGSYVDDFQANYYTLPPAPIIHDTRTQFERTDVDLKIARAAKAVDATSGVATTYVLSPGIFGSGDGRYVEGGYLQLSTFAEDDYIQCYIEDKKRYIAMAVALAINPAATEPLSDAEIIAMGPLPAPFNEAFPQYPIVKSYSDDELDAAYLADPTDQDGKSGWFFWPSPKGDGIPPGSETEVETFGFWGFVPAGFYIKIVVTRPTDKTGFSRLSINWAKSE